jgi:hypothetical protein
MIPFTVPLRASMSSLVFRFMLVGICRTGNSSVCAVYGITSAIMSVLSDEEVMLNLHVDNKNMASQSSHHLTVHSPYFIPRLASLQFPLSNPLLIIRMIFPHRDTTAYLISSRKRTKPPLTAPRASNIKWLNKRHLGPGTSLQQGHVLCRDYACA